MGPDGGPDFVKAARCQVVALPMVLLGEIVTTMHAAAFLTRQCAAVHPSRCGQHRRAFTRAEQFGRAGSACFRDIAPGGIEARQRTTEP